MSMLTQRQRDILLRRIERALCWYDVPSSYRDDARRSAVHVLDELELSGFSAAAQRRGIKAIVASLEVAADPVASVSPAERDAPPVADATDVGTGSAA